MNMTRTGRGELKNTLNSKIPVTMEISSELIKTVDNGTGTTGTLGGKTTNLIGVKSGRCFQSNITIYLGSIQEAMKDPYGDFSGLTLDESIGVVASHEAVHSVDPENIYLQWKGRTEILIEQKPVETHRAVAKEIKEKKAKG